MPQAKKPSDTCIEFDKNLKKIQGSFSEELNRIKTWVNQVELEPQPSHLEVLLKIIYFYLENIDKFNEKKIFLIENCLCIIINNFNQLPVEKNIELITYLNKYIHTEDISELEKIEAFSSCVSLSINVPEEKLLTKTTIFIDKIKGNLNKISIFDPKKNLAKISSKTQLNFEPIVGEANLVNVICKNRSKITKEKATIIDFDDKGKGYIVKPLSKKDNLDIESLEEEELKRLGKIDLWEKPSPQEFIEQIGLKGAKLFATEKGKETNQRKIEENIKKTTMVREIHRNTQKIPAKKAKIGKWLDPIIFPIRKQIDLLKQKPLVNHIYSLENLELPSFKGMNEELIANFIDIADYDYFIKLINSAELILISIKKVEVNLNKMNVFSKSLGLPQNCFSTLNGLRIEIKEVFCRAAIATFLENYLNLFIEHVLYSKNVFSLLEKTNQKEKIIFSNFDFLNLLALDNFDFDCSNFISDNSPTRIVERNSNIIKNFLLKNNEGILFNNELISNSRQFFKFLLNFILGKFYFLDKKHKAKFVKEISLNFQEQSISLELVRDVVLKMKWWDFILKGINPFHVFKREFKEILSQKLFLSMISEEFENVIKQLSLIKDQFKQDESIEEVTYNVEIVNGIDTLYSILDRLKRSNIGERDLNRSTVNLPDIKSRQEIIDELNNNEEVKKLLEKTPVLANNARLCTDEFSKLLNSCQQKSKKIHPMRISVKKISLLYNLKLIRPSKSNKQSFFSCYMPIDRTAILPSI